MIAKTDRAPHHSTRDARPDWLALERAIKGSVVLPGTPTYDQVRRPFIARFDDVKPRAIVYCHGAEDVRETIRFAQEAQIPLSVRSGGHCFAGYSTGPGIILDLAHMRAVSVTGDTARIEAGAKIGLIYDRLLEHGLTLPTGSCPTVGIGGTTLGGGLGVLGRKYGLTSDHVLAMEVVLADGRVVTCDASQHADLFWGLRGAGAGGLGVVTSFLFQLRPAPDMTNFYLIWPFAHAAAVFEAWQRWAPSARDEIAAGLAFTASDNIADPPIVEVFGAMIGAEADASAELDGLIAAVGAAPASDFRKGMTFRETAFYQAGLVSVANTQIMETAEGLVSRQGYRFTKSEYLSRPLPPQGIAALVALFDRERAAGEFRGLELAPWGGAYNRVRADATAFVHRDQLFSLKHAALVPPEASSAEKLAAKRWVEASWESVRPWGSRRVYPNFPDPDLPDWQTAYYGSNLDRLSKIKTAYDPGDFFRSPQSIPLTRGE